jgi:hypothetical protein
MSTTHLPRVYLPLPLTFNAIHPRHADNRATLTTALNAGWVTVQYCKADGTTATRMATRNLSIVKAFGTDDDIENLTANNAYPASILYFDYRAGGLRSFRVDSIREAYIPDSPPEINP